ncbi:hypothetical protein IMG5_009530 [Ichthyophthirius multifiliis]|uniref:Transmembrane protein n=1 Tax=Ichthyophthirius multifiliis TaxID=5932 RepID=G0QJV7_ICHMU|nr:hypothetical protein IMG5_009530 [Ichthyophthirius multifiliis]EGR34497.1 hypothetical protein IMG5_009530 [Ichthyophthirius multifiliis]|eukprot:XP_004039801.1 hypothetical protein IMG5_009530 [Ichthyophthirius multifiliis]
MKKLSLLFLIILIQQSQSQSETQSQPQTQLQSQQQEEKYQKCLCQKQLKYLSDPLEIEGKASVDLNDTQFLLQFSYETKDKDASTALKNNNDVVNKVLEELKKDESLTISTNSFSIQNDYDYVQNQVTQRREKQHVGYKVKNQIQVKSSELEKAEEVIQTAIENGFNTVDFVKYFPDDEQIQKVKNELIGEAVKNAQKKADIILKDLQYSVDSLKTSSIDYQQIKGQKMTMHVTVEFNIKQNITEKKIIEKNQIFFINEKILSLFYNKIYFFYQICDFFKFSIQIYQYIIFIKFFLLNNNIKKIFLKNYILYIRKQKSIIVKKILILIQIKQFLQKNEKKYQKIIKINIFIIIIVFFYQYIKNKCIKIIYRYISVFKKKCYYIFLIFL